MMDKFKKHSRVNLKNINTTSGTESVVNVQYYFKFPSLILIFIKNFICICICTPVFQKHMLKIIVLHFCSIRTHNRFSIQSKTFPEVEERKLLAISVTRCKYFAKPLPSKKWHVSKSLCKLSYKESTLSTVQNYLIFYLLSK
jgi:hypothetical protein